MDRLVSVKEAAEHLGCSKALLLKWIYQGKLPFVKVGRLTRIRKKDIKAWQQLGLNAPERGESHV